MYKSRLQEVCQSKQWPLPKYNTTKQGPDHNPRFKATVSVGDRSFDGPDHCRTTKEAEGEAARLAFEYCSGAAVSVTALGSSDASASNMATSNLPKSEEALETIQPCDNSSHATEIIQRNMDLLDLGFSLKSLLQDYTQKRNLGLPTYGCSRQGSCRAPHFRGRVTVDAQTFETAQLFKSIKEAENAVARIALESLYESSNQKDELLFFRSILQALVQKECLATPVYNTVKDGPPHMPVFSTTVEINDEKFVGTCASTKKQAEQNAAKVAWSTLKERKSNRLARHPFCNTPQAETTDTQQLGTPSSPLSCIRCKRSDDRLIQDEDRSTVPPKHIVNEDSPSNTSFGKHSFFVEKEAVLSGKSDVVQKAASAHFKEGTVPASKLIEVPPACDDMNLQPSDSILCELFSRGEMSSILSGSERRTNLNMTADAQLPGNMLGNQSLCNRTCKHASQEIKASSTSDDMNLQPSDPIPGKLSPSGNGISSVFSWFESSDHDMAGADARLPGNVFGNPSPCNRVCVYPRKPAMVLPEGATMLPFSDEKWVAVRLDDRNRVDGQPAATGEEEVFSDALQDWQA